MGKSSKGLKSALKSQQTRLKAKEREKAVQAAQLVAQRSSKKGGGGGRTNLASNLSAASGSGSTSAIQTKKSLKGKEKAPLSTFSGPATQRPTVPFLVTDKILLIGEGNFSFARALVCDPPGGLDHLPPSNITATAYDTEDECYNKYADAEEIVAELRERGVEVLFGVDATKLEKTVALKKRRWNKIVWNFPHAGKGIADQDRNILSNQKLILGFLRSAARHLVAGLKPEFVVKKKKNTADDDEDEEEDEVESDEDAMDVTPAAKSSRGTVLITLRNVVPYTQWDVPRLAKNPPPPTGSEPANPRYILHRSFRFHREIWKGYGHRMTKGERGGTGEGGEDRCWEFYVGDDYQIQ